MLISIPERGSTPHLVGVCLNRIGTEERWAGIRPLRRNRLSFATSKTVQRTMAAKLPPNLTSNRMREFAASGSPTGLSGSNPISPRIKQTGS